MSETPSKRRSKGREAFEPGCDPLDFQPYKKGTWDYDYNLDDWLEGWHEAEAAYEEQANEEPTTTHDWLDPETDLVAAIRQIQDILDERN